jgi:predicted glutamine amidotransferase
MYVQFREVHGRKYMCRLLGYVAREPIGPSELLGDAFAAFIKLSEYHSDGWGLAWYDAQDRLRLDQTPEAAYASAAFATRSRSVCADALIAHLRKATPGLAVTQENTHPFIRAGVAFAHNGSVEPVREIEALIAPRLRGSIAGATDSERYFLALLSALDGSSPVEAFRTAFRLMRERLRYTSLNCLLLTPDVLYAVCYYDPHHPQVQRRFAMDPAYADVSYRVTPDAVVVGSSGWQQGSGWQLLGNGQMLVIERGTLHPVIVDIVDGRTGS